MAKRACDACDVRRLAWPAAYTPVEWSGRSVWVAVSRGPQQMHVSGGLWPNSARRGNPDLTLSSGSNLGYDTSLRTPVARESCGCSWRRSSLFAAARRTDAACCAKTVNARGGRPICSRPGGYQSASRPRHGKQPRQPAAALREWPRGGHSIQQAAGRPRCATVPVLCVPFRCRVCDLLL